VTSRILFLTTNGAGLGHLTRGMAIARRLPEDVQPLFFTLSQALPVVRRLGFYAEYLFSAGYAGTDRYDWNVLYERRLLELVDLYQPEVVVFDGAYPYTGVVAVSRMVPEPTYVWCRRAMWREGVGEETASRMAFFDGVLEPGEFAAEADRGVTVAQRARVTRVDPIVLLDPAELLTRDEARAELGLRPEATAVLVQLGAGNINDLGSVSGICVDALRRSAGVQVVFAESTISTRRAELPDDVIRLRTYPLARYANAFDFAVTAAGYNSYHELLAYGVPSIFQPNTRTALDDQLARARYAERAGVARSWEDPTAAGFAACLEPLLDAAERAAMRRRLEERALGDGAAQAAAHLAALAGGQRGEA
jgi:UDP:flavonoid glycosyltransferase YjiC (YdhE family)